MDTCTNVPDMCRREKQSPWWEGGGCRCHRREAQSRTRVDSVRVGLFVVQDTNAPGGDCGTADHFHPPAGKQTRLHQPSDTKDSTQLQILMLRMCAHVPLKSVFALRSEVVDVGLEMQLEDIVLVDVFRLWGDGDWVTQQGKAGQWIIILRDRKTK